MGKHIPFSVAVSVEGEWRRLLLKGQLTEEAKPKLLELVAEPKGKYLLDFGQVTSINSCGVRDWSFFLKAFRQDREVVFDRVTDDIVRTMNMVANFHAGLPVKSVYRAYDCEQCGGEQQAHFQEGKDYHVGAVPQIPPRTCEKCGGVATAIESDDEFFLFLVA